MVDIHPASGIARLRQAGAAAAAIVDALGRGTEAGMTILQR